MTITISTIESVTDEELLDFQREFLDNKELIHGSNGLTYEKNIEKWRGKIARLASRPAKNECLTKQFIILNEDKKLVGMIDLRLYLKSYLEQEGGHIGYSVRKSSRGEHYASLALKEVIHYAHQNTNLTKVLLTCKEQNIVSKQIIINSKGKFSQKITINKQMIEHYWITL